MVFATLPNTSSNTITFGFGSVDILPQTDLKAKDAQVALDKEDYETAAKLRDQIKNK